MNEDPKELINIFVQTLVKIAEVAYEESQIKYKKLIKQIDNTINSTQDKKEKSKLFM